jgi:hypothetical protein
VKVVEWVSYASYFNICSVLTCTNDSFPCKIGSKITLEEYNKFLERKESSGYKYERKVNGDVYVIDMNDPEHGAVVSLLLVYFNVANGGAIINQPIYSVLRKKLRG